MEPERWQKVEQIYGAALGVEESQRARFLADACGGQISLQEDVETLLAQTGSDSFLKVPAIQVAAKALAHDDGRMSLPAVIGRYRVLRLLGEGGMGIVYEAEQDQPRRTVALKVIKPGFSSAGTLRRFRDESHALGRLQHPGIAQIYDAGTADTGRGTQPYFAMELIRGQALHEYAEAHQLKARDRLTLMAKICDAVDHAHQRGVIHRDLKMSNILVDQSAQPKILDFGVARVTDSDMQHTRQTDVGQLIGTLAYMSPEQVMGDPSVLDARSDVYTLGVILYELLAGTLPYDVLRKPLPEAVAVIREEEPVPLSSIDRAYRGDVDTIVAKALEKDKARRYSSAAELAGDIRHHLADEPIAARPASAGYRVQKFARRQKALVAGAAAVFVVLAAGVVASTVEAVRARRAEAVAQAVNDFLQNDLLAQASSSQQSGAMTRPDPDLKVRTALDRAAAKVSGKFSRQPEVEAAIRDTIGQTYADLGLYPDARKQLQRALDLQRQALGADNPKTLSTMVRLGRVARAQGKYAEAEKLISQALAKQRRVLGSAHIDTLKSMGSLAGVYRAEGKNEQAMALLRENLETERREFGPESPDTLASMHMLATTYHILGKHAQAIDLFRQTLEIRRRVLGPEHPETLVSMTDLADVYAEQGQHAQAEALLSQAVEIRRRVLGQAHPQTLYAMNQLARVNFALGKYDQAEALYTEAVATRRRVLGPEHPDTLLADIYTAQGKYAQAEALYLQTLENQRRVFGANNPETVQTLSRFVPLYEKQGKYAEAEGYGVQALAGLRRMFGSDDPDTMAVALDLAQAYLAQGKFVEAEPLAREALTVEQKTQPDNWQRFRAESLLGASLAGEKKYADAEAMLLEAYRGMLARQDRIAAPQRYHLDQAHEWLLKLYQAWGKPEKAALWTPK